MEKRILLVDDSKPLLALLSGVFRSNYEVISKSSAITALTYLHSGALPDLIITDLVMPEMDGFEFVKQLKANSFSKDIPIMILSGNQASADRLKLYKMGIDEYLTKPFNPEELYIRADKLVERVRKYSLHLY